MLTFLVAAVVATAPIPTTSSPTTVRFSNIQFDTGGNWTVAQSSPQMVLQSTNAGVKGHVHIAIAPAAPFAGTLEQGREAAWTTALAGRATTGEIVRDDEREVLGGGNTMTIGASLSPAGGLYVIVVQAGPKLTKLTLSADTDMAYQLGSMLLGPVLLSLEVVPEGGPVGGSVGDVGPGPLGPDPSDQFDWDGPDWFEYGVYDHGCREVDDEFEELVRRNQGLIGAVKPRVMSYADALASARKLLSNSEAKAQFDAAKEAGAKESPMIFIVGAAAREMEGDPFGALAHMLAGMAVAPDDPTVIFNFASVLAQVGMPNESMAVMKQLTALGKKPSTAVGIKPDAAMSYVTGYDEMLRGNLGEAESQFQLTIGMEPFLNEASSCLSLIQAHQGAGASAKQTYLDGMWRFKPKTLLMCGSAATQRPGVDEMFDTSKGLKGVLADFRHPKNADELSKFLATMADLGLQVADSMTAHGKRQIQLSAGLNRGPDAPAYDVWADKMSTLMEGLDEFEPLLLELQAEEEASREDAAEATSRAAIKLWNKELALTMSSKGNHCAEFKANTTQALAEARPYIVHWETKQRRYASAWYRMTTGINAHIGNQHWHDFNDASLRSTLQTLNVGMIGSIAGAYSAISAVSGLIPDCIADTTPQMGSTEPEEGPKCPSGLKGLGFKYSFELGANQPGGPKSVPKLGFKVDCEKFTIDIEYPLAKVNAGALADFSVGGFAQIEMARDGSWTVFAGAKGSISAGAFGASEKSGLYVKGNAREGMTDLGGRVSLEASGKASEFSVSKSDKMDFSILPAPNPPKLGPGLRAFTNQ